FGFGCSIAALTACLVTGLAPLIMVASAPFAAIGLSAALMVGAFAVGAIATTAYHKYVAPNQAQMKETSSILPLIKQKNIELTKKLDDKKQIIENEKQKLANIEADNDLLHTQVIKDSDALHKQLDPAYQKAQQPGAAVALQIANHDQVKSHISKPDLASMSQEDNTLGETIGKKVRLLQNEDEELPSKKRPRESSHDLGVA
ncbi:MAG: hypothetical protein ACK4PR_09850, partial [Gammaproteobacteria bacterium]